MSKQWKGETPEKCDICGNKLKGTFIDGRTVLGPWAIMCRSCHPEHGVGLGLGRGQVYLVKEEEPDHDLVYHDKKCEEEVS